MKADIDCVDKIRAAKGMREKCIENPDSVRVSRDPECISIVAVQDNPVLGTVNW